MQAATFIFRGKMSKRVKIITESFVCELDDSGLVESSDKSRSESIGSYTVIDGGFTISYRESIGDTDTDPTDTELIYKDGNAVLKRRGSVICDLEFREGEKTVSVYTVPPYSFDTVIHTKRLRAELLDGKATVSILYDMEIGGAKKNVRMKIAVTEL